MSCEITIIAEGYSKDVTEKSMRANCSSVLIRDGPVNIIVDTMTAWDSEYILKKLTEICLHPEEIHFVINTHGHSDHNGSNHLFLKARHVTGNSMSHGDLYDFFEASGFPISPNVRLQATPGHTAECVAVHVTGTEFGKVLISGDLFEKEEDIIDASIWESAGSHDKKAQRLNRHLMSLDADYIIPGHGPMFKVTPEYRDILNAQK